MNIDVDNYSEARRDILQNRLIENVQYCLTWVWNDQLRSGVRRHQVRKQLERQTREYALRKVPEGLSLYILDVRSCQKVRHIPGRNHLLPQDRQVDCRTSLQFLCLPTPNCLRRPNDKHAVWMRVLQRQQQHGLEPVDSEGHHLHEANWVRKSQRYSRKGKIFRVAVQLSWWGQSAFYQRYHPSSRQIKLWDQGVQSAPFILLFHEKGSIEVLGGELEAVCPQAEEFKRRKRGRYDIFLDPGDHPVGKGYFLKQKARVAVRLHTSIREDMEQREAICLPQWTVRHPVPVRILYRASAFWLSPI